MTDHLLRCVALEGRVRVVVADASDTVEELRRIHDPSPTTTAALGRVATGALLMAASLEKVTTREPLLTIELNGDGPAGRFLATASPAGWVRAMVANPHATAESVVDGKLNVAGVVGTRGELAVTRDPGVGEPYRGVVPLRSGEIAQDVAHYLNDSEQTPAAVVLGVHVLPEGRVDNAGGVLVQLLPGVSDDQARTLTQRVRELGAVTARMVAGQGPQDWLRLLFPDGLEILEETPVRFHCGCSRERVETALRLLGAAEIRELLRDNPDRPTRLTCEFCQTVYEVPPERLAELLLELDDEGGQQPVN